MEAANDAQHQEHPKEALLGRLAKRPQLGYQQRPLPYGLIPTRIQDILASGLKRGKITNNECIVILLSNSRTLEKEC